jgi:cobyrinic acid a,c-diamide synthase
LLIVNSSLTLIIAGERSGVGKTTITLALLAGLRKYSRSIQCFKVGPDYIDPMFHTYITDRAARNLDPILTSTTYVQSCFDRHSRSVDYALVEGVMGLFDGILTDAPNSPLPHSIPTASTADVAQILDLPIALVVDCSRLSYSVAAIVHGYCSLHPKLKFAGVFLNRVASDRHLELLKNALEPLSIPILGVFGRHEEITIPDRHLGLIPTVELPQLDLTIDRLADLATTSFNWDLLLPLLQVDRHRRTLVVSSSPPTFEQPLRSQPPAKIPIAVARDRAFNFYYQDNLDLLIEQGAELIYWSPLQDSLPPDVRGLYFGGGFPEVFATELADNLHAREQVALAIRSGLPTYAECGGLMYLCREIINFDGQSFPMVGIVPTTAKMDRRLTLGYRQATVLPHAPLLPQGVSIRGHEFHRSSLTTTPDRPLYQMQNYARHPQSFTEGWQSHRLHASYLHIHFGQNPIIPQQFIQTCQQLTMNN